MENTEELNIKQKLLRIQVELKAPKTRWNRFGEYYSRSCEDIMDGVKPLLEKYECILKIKNDLEVINGFIFRKSTAQIVDTKTCEYEEVYTYTQEAMSKPKMSPEQCSGSTASYSDKYVLGKLFCIDDTKDADEMPPQDKDKRKQAQQPQRQQTDYKAKYAAIAQIKDLAGKACKNKTTQEKGEYMHRYMGVNKFEELNKFSLEELNKIIALIK